MKRIRRFPQPAGPLDPPDPLTLIFRQRHGTGFRYLVDGTGFVANHAAEATPIRFRSGDRSVLWSSFDADLGGLQAVVPFELLEDGPAAVTARSAAASRAACPIVAIRPLSAAPSIGSTFAASRWVTSTARPGKGKETASHKPGSNPIQRFFCEKSEPGLV